MSNHKVSVHMPDGNIIPLKELTEDQYAKLKQNAVGKTVKIIFRNPKSA